MQQIDIHKHTYHKYAQLRIKINAYKRPLKSNGNITMIASHCVKLKILINKNTQ